MCVLDGDNTNDEHCNHINPSPSTFCMPMEERGAKGTYWYCREGSGGMEELRSACHCHCHRVEGD